jgi:hypothetical protein
MQYAEVISEPVDERVDDLLQGLELSQDRSPPKLVTSPSPIRVLQPKVLKSLFRMLL